MFSYEDLDMPTVTSTRYTPENQDTKYSRYATVWNIFGSSGSFTWKPPAATQTTTSFRSSAREGDLVHDDVLLTGGTWAKASRHATRNPWTSRKSEHDTGHPFSTSKIFYTDISHPVWEGYGGTWRGPLIPRLTGTGLNNIGTYPAIPDQPSLVVQGVQAIRDTLPTKSPAALAQALLELKREGLPKVSRAIDDLLFPKSGRDLGRAVGSGHLTAQFGVKPLLRDLEDAIGAIKNGEEILREFEDGVGKRQHRQRTFEPRVYAWSQEESNTAYRQVANFHGVNAFTMRLNSHSGTHATTERRVEIQDYFKGAYIYHLPEMKKSSEAAEFARKYQFLTGLELSASLLWELAPWSWLSDWVVNIGDNIAVAEALRDDGLVLLYGYMMRKTHYTATRTVYNVPAWSGTVPSVSITYNKVVKERIRATPYGFGLNTSGFSGRQWAILGALGLTKGNNSLRLSD